MNPGEIWRHKRCLDVDIYIVMPGRSPNPSQITLTVRYWNRAGWFHDGYDAITIKNKDLKNWSKV